MTDTTDTKVPLIYLKIGAIMRDLDPIEKDKENKFYRFKFRGIDDYYNALHPIFAKHGVFLTSEVLTHAANERNTKNEGLQLHHLMRIKFTCWAEDGSNVCGVVEGEAADVGDKGAGKAQAYALKIFLTQIGLIPTNDPSEDPDALAVEFEKEKTATKPAAGTVQYAKKTETPQPATPPTAPQEPTAPQAELPKDPYLLLPPDKTFAAADTERKMLWNYLKNVKHIHDEAERTSIFRSVSDAALHKPARDIPAITLKIMEEYQKDLPF